MKKTAEAGFSGRLKALLRRNGFPAFLRIEAVDGCCGFFGAFTEILLEQGAVLIDQEALDPAVAVIRRPGNHHKTTGMI